MNIQIRVAEAQARRALQGVRTDLVQVNAAARAANQSSGSIGTGGNLTKWGSQVQWAGRQLMYNFTLPLALAAGAATKFALDNEKAMVRVAKVYGDSSIASGVLQNELQSLEKAFVALSNRFGVNQAEVINVAGAWAAAGASGLALAEATKLTLETMILGELQAEEATTALISIQAQYGQSVGELSKTISVLNMVENETTVTMKDLIESMSRSAGVARTAGVDVLHLAAMTASLVPATGSAATAGNGLKTIMSRLLSPTKEAAEVMGLMGINTKDMGWQSLTASQRLEKMSDSFVNLDEAQKTVVSSVIASRYQINRFSVLMDDMNDKNGRYAKTLRMASDETANLTQKEAELDAVLNSNPQRLKQMWTILQNAMADVVQPLIKYIVALAQWIANLARAFSNLDPVIQKFVLAGLAILAIIGPLGRYIGASAVLFGFLGSALAAAGTALAGFLGFMLRLVMLPFKAISAGFGAISRMVGGVAGLFRTLGPRIATALAAFGPRLLGLLTGPIGIAITVVSSLLILFRKQVASLWGQVVDSFSGENARFAAVFTPLVKFFHTLVDGIHRAFNRLPEGVKNAFMSVVNVVKAAVMKIYELFSWMRPEVRHSPSLIESVTNGMAEIKRQYASVGNAGAVFKKAAGDLKAFKQIAASMGNDEWSDKRADVSAVMPQGLGAFNALVDSLAVMNRLLGEQDSLVSKQEAVVNRWNSALDSANAQLDEQSNALDGLRTQLNGLEDAYAAHEESMNSFANSSIVGMGAMSDAIFDNEIAQKKLRLEILRLGEAGSGVDDLASRLSSLQGDIEALRGTSNDLRASGAGSDVLGPINDQIKQMEAAYDALEGAGNTGGGSATSALQKQLEELQRQAEILDLEKALQFDPLLHQIEKVVDGTKELTFEQIIAGVKDERAAMDALKPSIDAATRAVANQQAAVDSLTAARDAIKATYDAEKTALSQLQDEYSFTADAIREIESALNDVATAASSARAASSAASGAGGGSMSPGAENFIAADGANFLDAGGSGFSGREGGLEDQSALIDAFTLQTADDMASLFSDVDMFGPIKRLWGEFKAWWDSNVVPAWRDLVDGISGYFGSLDFSGFGEKASEIGDWFAGVWDGAKKVWDSLADLFGPQLSEIWNKIKEGFSKAIEPLKGEFSKWGDAMEPVVEWLKNLKVVGVVALGAIVAAFSIAFSVIGNIVRPVIDWIVQLFRSIVQVVRGVVEGVTGILNGMVNIVKGIVTLLIGIFTFDPEMIKSGFRGIVDGVIQIFWGLLHGVSSIVDGLWDLIFQTFKSAGEILWGIVVGIVEGIVDFFVWLWDVLVGHSIIPDLVEAIKEWFINMKDKVVETVKAFVEGVIKWFTDLYNGLVEKVQAIWTAVTNKFNDIKNSLITKVTEIYNSVTSWFSSIWSKLVEIVQGIWSSVTNKFGEIKTSLATKVSEIYTSVTGKFGEVRDKIGEVVETLKNNVSNKFTNIRDAMLGAFEWVRDKISGIFNSITSYIKTGINAAIGVVNGLISGLNKVADILPGLDWSISSIPLMAQGGTVPNQRVGGGFATNKARAIVGEGSNAHKEYVVPTDPRFRKRATGLYEQLGKDLGLPTDYSALGIGGFSLSGIKNALGSAKDMLASGADWVKTTAQGAVSTVFKPFKTAADNSIAKVGWKFGKKTAQSGLDNIWEWVVGGDEAFKEKGGEAKLIQDSLAGWKRPMTTYTLSSPFGYRIHPITGQRKLHAGMDMAASTGTNIYAVAAGMLSQMITSGGLGKHALIDHGGGIKTQYGHMNSFVGGPGQVSAGQLIGKVGSTGASTGPHLHFEIYQNGTAINPSPYMAGRGVPLNGVSAAASLSGGGRGHTTALATGGIVRSRPGGIMANIGEGRHDEAVIPLPNGWEGLFDSVRNTGTMPSHLNVQRLVVTGSFEVKPSTLEPQTVTNNTFNNNYHFHGDLNFPNIQSGDDAEMFLANLGDLAGGGGR